MARVGVDGDYYGAGSGVDGYGSATSSDFIVQLYANKVLKNFYASTAYEAICNTDYEGEIKNKGDKVIIRRTPTISTGDYTIGATITYEVPVEDSTELLIDKAKYQAFKIDDIDKVQSDLPLLNTFAADGALNMGITVDTEVLDYMGTATDLLAANKGATAGAISGDINLGVATAPVSISTTNAIDKIVHMGLVLDEQNIPRMGRYMVIPSWYSALLKLGDLKRADITGDGTGVIRSGQIGSIDDTMLYVNNNIKHVTDGTTSTECFYVLAGTSEAVSFAAQISKTDTLKIPTSFGEYWRTLYVYGRKLVQPKALAVGYFDKA